MKFHGVNSLNKGVRESKNSYHVSENFFNMNNGKSQNEYDFFNSRMSTEAEFAKKFINQVTSLCIYPEMLKDNQLKNCDILPESIVKAETYIKQIKVGAYTCSKGIESVRKNVSKYLSNRDKVNTDPDDVYLTYGGMDAYQHILSLFSKDDTVFNFINFRYLSRMFVIHFTLL